METIVHPPRTLMEVFDLLPEGTLAELIDNQLFMSPAPLFNHQKAVKSISFELDKIIEQTRRGLVIIAPFDVKLDKASNVVQPDITVILKSNPNQIIEGRYMGVPDMIVEVLSEGNRNHDLIIKKELYERFGVQEYWIVDPQNKLALGYCLTKSSFQKIGEAIGLMESRLLQTKIPF